MDIISKYTISSSMKNSYQVIIAGGGLIGSLMAIALADYGIRTALIDTQGIRRKENKIFDGRAYALSLTTARFLSSLNIWENVVKKATPILDIKVSDGYAKFGAHPFFMHFDHKEVDEGSMGFMLEDRFLRKELYRKVSQSPLIQHFPSSMIIYQKPRTADVEVQLDNSRILHCKLLIGSDGKSSSIGTNAGIQRINYDYDQVSLVSAVKHELSHNGEAHQFFMPPGPLAILPLPGNRSSIVWTEKRSVAEQINDLSAEKYLSELKLRFGDFRGEIKLDGKRFAYPLSLSVSEKIIAQRVALIGDAAHSLHPVAGQGLNLGIRDIASLTEVLVTAGRRGEDIGNYDVLDRYSVWRNFDRTSLYLVTHSVNRLFSNNNIFLKTARDLGMGAIEKLPFVKKELIRNATGLAGDLPSMMRGNKI